MSTCGVDCGHLGLVRQVVGYSFGVNSTLHSQQTHCARLYVVMRINSMLCDADDLCAVMRWDTGA